MTASFKDLLLSPQGWINELVKAEIHPDAERVLQLGRGYDPQQLVEESTIEFLADLREKFSESARLFNSYSEGGKRFQEVKVYGMAQTAADFMIFRNQIKLLISNVAHGIIQISFAQHARTNFAVDGQTQINLMNGSSQATSADTLDNLEPQELMARIGPFHDVHWVFHDEKINPEQVAKFYFVEFVKLTRDSRRSKTGNKLLLDQIKALLEEKGLNL